MRWIWPPEGFFTERDLPKLQHIPLLLDEATYPVEVNRYVEERSLGEWAPGMLHEDDDPVVLTVKSRANLATRLCAFFYWVSQKQDRDWRTLDYTEVLNFQVGLLKGSANASGSPLKESTVNAYVDEACSFLKWSSERGLREEFRVPRRRRRIVNSSRGNHSRSHRGRMVSVRHGTLRTSEPQLDILPTAEQIERWMALMRRRHPVKAIEFEVMLRTGCRVSEAHFLRVDCFPREANWTESWRKLGAVPIRLRYGVKGPKVLPGSDLSTTGRIIYIPVDLAERIEHYLRFIRPTLLARLHRDDRQAVRRSDRLWIGEHTSRPVAYSTIYKAWTTCPHCPDGWHPHAARHYFSVERVVESMRDLIALNGLEERLSANGVGWLHGLMAGQIRLILSPLLGHVDEKTSERYCRAARARLLGELGHPLIRWNSIVDADLEEVGSG